MSIGSGTSQKMDELFENINAWPRSKRILVCVVLVCVIVAVFYFLSYKPRQESITKLKTGLTKLDRRLKVLKSRAAQKEKFEKELAEAERSFKLAMKALPDKKEIPSLMRNISQSGVDVGLEILLFAPKPEQIKNFYAEIPVQMKVKGGYHNVAQFFEAVAGLPRIVNIKDITMASAKAGEALETTCKAVTYKFVENQPEKDGKGKKKKK
ncbi:MAG: protein PilO [Deltaproteobacteria bacterium]|nr:MAG: protein PilO [Deltaproteobacteria bacterium]